MDSDSTNNHIGEKIKLFRTRAGITQLDLENLLGLATGSLTKIESGKVIPMRETLLKIINQLELNPYESCLLLGLPLSKITEIIDLISEINLLSHEEDVAQKAVNDIPSKLGLLGASSNVVVAAKIKTFAVTQSWFTELVEQVLPSPSKDFNVSLNKDTNNFLVKSVLENRKIYGERLSAFTTPYMSAKLSDMVQRVVGVKSLLAVPMVVAGWRLGVMLYVKNQKMGFEDEIPLLESFTKAVATKIYSLRQNSV